MIIVNLKGGMGNQMFQYALGYSLAKQKKMGLFLDLRFLNTYRKEAPKGYVDRDYCLDLFGIEPKLPRWIDLLKSFQIARSYKNRYVLGLLNSYIFGYSVLETSKTSFGSLKAKKKASLYLDGHWQALDYFSDCETDIRDIFSNKVVDFEVRHERFISSICKFSDICVNVRRTDFIGNPFHDLCTIEYYERGINALLEQRPSGKIFIFSDDVDWCKSAFRAHRNAMVVDHSLAGDRFIDYFHLMSMFGNFVIPNSTFAWWAAWLSKVEGKRVIMPKEWTLARQLGGRMPGWVQI